MTGDNYFSCRFFEETETKFMRLNPWLLIFNVRIFLSHTHHVINDRLRKQFHKRRKVRKIDPQRGINLSKFIFRNKRVSIKTSLNLYVFYTKDEPIYMSNILLYFSDPT
jgi:hypothetical protein